MDKNFIRQIRAYEKTFNELHQDVYETWKQRKKNPQAWKASCEKFHAFRSPIQTYYNEIYASKNFNNAELMEFVVTFLEVNPMFFRSGYLKEIMLRKLKRTQLSNQNIDRLRMVIIDAVKNRGYREFREYCKLALLIGDQNLLDFLQQTMQTGNAQQQSRAKYMYRFVTDKKHSNRLKQ